MGFGFGSMEGKEFRDGFEFFGRILEDFEVGSLLGWKLGEMKLGFFKDGSGSCGDIKD